MGGRRSCERVATDALRYNYNVHGDASSFDRTKKKDRPSIEIWQSNFDKFVYIEPRKVEK
jgi:hypothetical protein